MLQKCNPSDLPFAIPGAQVPCIPEHFPQLSPNRSGDVTRLLVCQVHNSQTFYSCPQEPVTGSGIFHELDVSVWKGNSEFSFHRSFTL